MLDAMERIYRVAQKLNSPELATRVVAAEAYLMRRRLRNRK